ncbi:unnamed protein product [Paramecium octaurelia]|uniref:Uncharacterized protein n=1 Tax=Paramecium octaurelia TaxID=43137 RepID=A0A8S1SEC5_PAROT|nr:unnamed protein product [Paramecium octaurelia]
MAIALSQHSIASLKRPIKARQPIWIVYTLTPFVDEFLSLDLRNPSKYEQNKLQSEMRFKLSLYVCVIQDWISLILRSISFQTMRSRYSINQVLSFWVAICLHPTSTSLMNFFIKIISSTSFWEQLHWQETYTSTLQQSISMVITEMLLIPKIQQLH